MAGARSGPLRGLLVPLGPTEIEPDRGHLSEKCDRNVTSSFGAHLRMAGCSLAGIADLLGHKDLATNADLREGPVQEHLRTVVGKLSGLISDDVSLKAIPRAGSIRSCWKPTTWQNRKKEWRRELESN